MINNETSFKEKDYIMEGDTKLFLQRKELTSEKLNKKFTFNYNSEGQLTVAKNENLNEDGKVKNCVITRRDKNGKMYISHNINYIIYGKIKLCIDTIGDNTTIIEFEDERLTKLKRKKRYKGTELKENITVDYCNDGTRVWENDTSKRTSKIITSDNNNTIIEIEEKLIKSENITDKYIRTLTKNSDNTENIIITKNEELSQTINMADNKMILNNCHYNNTIYRYEYIDNKIYHYINDELKHIIINETRKSENDTHIVSLTYSV